VKIWQLFCLYKLDGQKLKNRLGNRNNRIQHVQIVLKSQIFSLYPKMPLEVTFLKIRPEYYRVNYMPENRKKWT